MRKIILLALAISILGACSKVSESRLVGQWELSQLLLDKDDLDSGKNLGNYEHKLRFNEDGSVFYEKYYTVTGDLNDTLRGTWELDKTEEILTISLPKNEILDQQATYKIKTFNRRYLVFNGAYHPPGKTYENAQWQFWKP